MLIFVSQFGGMVIAFCYRQRLILVTRTFISVHFIFLLFITHSVQRKVWDLIVGELSRLVWSVKESGVDSERERVCVWFVCVRVCVCVCLCVCVCACVCLPVSVLNVCAVQE
jgi:hypothetical protein